MDPGSRGTSVLQPAWYALDNVMYTYVCCRFCIYDVSTCVSANCALLSIQHIPYISAHVDLSFHPYLPPYFSTGTSMDWIKTVFTGSPLLGWHDTLCFLSLPLILYMSQTISMKILQPKKDPKKILTDQEQISQGVYICCIVIISVVHVNYTIWTYALFYIQSYNC